MTATSTVTRCPDCQVEPGSPHEIGCDVARCPVCGIQQLQCRDHEFAEVFSTWTGVWPGTAECEREGWWCVWRPGNGGWVTCQPSHPEAMPDLNRLLIVALSRRELVWSREHQQWVRPATP